MNWFKISVSLLFAMWFQPVYPFVFRGKYRPFQTLTSSYARNEYIGSLVSRSAKKSDVNAMRPEFSRVINIAQVSPLKPTGCRLLAKPEERAGLARRFELPDLSYFASNVTVARKEEYSIKITGTFEARVDYGKMHGVQTITGEFDTLLLNNAEGPGSGLNFEDATDYDDEVKAGGNIDIGEISAQYFSLELS